MHSTIRHTIMSIIQHIYHVIKKAKYATQNLKLRRIILIII